MNPADWGLPPDFSPVRYALSDEAKNAIRPLLNPNEPVVVSLANEGDTVTIVATPQRVFVVKTGALGAGASGTNVREFPFEGIFDIVKRPQTHNLTLAIHYRSNDGKRVEVGRRALLARERVENLMPFEIAAGEDVFRALLQIWNWKRAQNGDS